MNLHSRIIPKYFFGIITNSFYYSNKRKTDWTPFVGSPSPDFEDLQELVLTST